MSNPGGNSQEPLALVNASVQEIQLELIRRTQFNAFDGRRVVASLLSHNELWRAVILDRIGIRSGHGLPGMQLIKLRDLPHNIWNADTLYILCASADNARRLAKMIEDEEWGGMVIVYDKPDEVDWALGGSDHRAIVAVWWD